VETNYGPLPPSGEFSGDCMEPQWGSGDLQSSGSSIQFPSRRRSSARIQMTYAPFWQTDSGVPWKDLQPLTLVLLGAPK
jgi:hypothetical protein